MKTKHLTVAERVTYRSLEDVVGCKWSAAIVAALGRGVHRPGQLERFIPGISTKVLTERLRRMLAYGLITRMIWTFAQKVTLPSTRVDQFASRYFFAMGILWTCTKTAGLPAP
jgi:hypothetical protein